MAKKPHLGIWDRVRAGLLLECELRRQHGRDLPDEWPPAVRYFRELPVLARLGYVRSWLTHIKPNVEDVFAVCDALIQHVRTVRDEELDTFRQRREFITEARKVWPEIQRIALYRVEATRALGDERTAEELEVQLLSWSEQFENRMLLEEIRLTRERAGDDGANVELDWSNRWGFTEAWEEQGLSSWSPEAVRDWCEERRRRLDATTQFASVAALHARCLREVAVENEEPIQVENDENADSLETNVNAFSYPAFNDEPVDFSELVPEEAVWIRTLFDADGTLRWWAWTRHDAELERLASGQSGPEALDRLKRANLDFDLTVERIWDACDSRRFPDPDSNSYDADRRFIRTLHDAVTDDAYRHLSSRQDLFAFVSFVDDGLDRLRNGNPALAVVGSQILADLRAGLVPSEIRENWHWGQWERGLAALDDPWSGDLTGSEREIQRRRELDLATEDHLALLLREIDLSLLANHNRDWHNTDFVFQVQGPLLAMPLASLDFGGVPLFRKVASTSTCVSLALRHNAVTRCGKSPTPSRNLLSVQWEEVKKRDHAHGFPLLHAGLRTLIGYDHFWALGDAPLALPKNLSAALTQNDFGLVVIAAHGRPQAAGVKLADPNGYWCGEEADFNDVDLLILVSCAVGRMSQRNNHDVEGLYARLATHGARCVVAARWPISDVEAACLIIEFAEQYLAELDRIGRIEPFSRARSLNRARRRLLDHSDAAMRITAHQAAAFDIYGFV